MNKKKLKNKKNDYCGVSPWERKQQKNKHVDAYTSWKFGYSGISLIKFIERKYVDARMYTSFEHGPYIHGIKDHIAFNNFPDTKLAKNLKTVDSTCRLCVRI